MTKRLTELDVHRALLETSKGLEALAGAMEALQADSKRTEVDQARINTRLEDMLVQLRGLIQTVRGDQGILSRVTVLETEVRNLKAQIDSQQRLSDQALNALRADITKLKALLDTRVKQELNDARRQITEERDKVSKSRSYRLAVASALIAALATVVSVYKDCGLATREKEPPRTGTR